MTTEAETGNKKFERREQEDGRKVLTLEVPTDTNHLFAVADDGNVTIRQAFHDGDAVRRDNIYLDKQEAIELAKWIMEVV